MKKEKLIGLQILRGMAAWLVVLHHINQVYYNYNPPFQLLSIFNFGNFGVDIFFVLSGFIMYYSVKNNSQGGIVFLIDRCFRIFPVYWVMTALLLISKIILPANAYGTSFTFESLIKSLFLIPHANPSGFGFFPFLAVGWTLVYEMVFYITLSFALMIYQKGALIISSLFLLILLLFGKNNIFGSSNLLLLEFVSGIALAYLFIRIKVTNFFLVLSKSFYSVSVLVLTIIFTSLLIYKLGYLITKMICAVLIVFSFLLNEELFRKKLNKSSLGVVLGDISYSTYLIHTIILGWFIIPFGSAQNVILKAMIVLAVLFLTYFLSKLSFSKIEISKNIGSFRSKIKEYLIK
ncbi:hypothetical protein PK35_02260 [Tamlana nanhaiensis]|uniref:Acyltransferase 3 domain-containing protein n=1 Tax=Neotamlana nanhaiensis TaxID=1382798 RepID=A0A0D7W6F9_9FLAO|nr:acyltransferase [Tamlana nanhaiensis]KJD34624.1 hypothetical protein PK35_02260 [Tamlana nanhaiensis]